MCQMRYTYKFLMLGMVVAAVVAYLLYNLYDGLSRTVESASAKRGGSAAIESISHLVQVFQQHRGLSAAVLNGNDGMRDKLSSKNKEVGELLKSVEERLTPALRGTDRWKQVGDEWERLRGEGLRWSIAENFATHSRLIDKTLAFSIDVADETSLTFDPDIDTYYLVDTSLTKLPLALERLGQLRAKGVSILTKRQISEQQKVELTSLVAEINYALRALDSNLDKTMRYSPALASSIRTAADSVDGAAAKVLKLVSDDIISGTFTTVPEDYFDLATAVIDQGYQQAYGIFQPAMRGLIDARGGRAEKKLVITMFISSLLLLFIFYFSIGTYYATIDSVNDLADGARRIAGGDLRVRINLRTKDEHKLVGDSFNEMAATFSKLLRNVQSNAHQVLDMAMQIASSSAQIASSTHRQSASASGMSASVEEMSVGVENISNHARDAHSVSTQAGALSAQGGVNVATVVVGIEKIADAVNASANVIQNLGHHSGQISTIVGVINEIADQTNLLALNAAIEAARAGESGRGFAVVADEVRKLAERTSKSTHEITVMIDAIQDGTQSAVSSMQDGVARVGEGVVLARMAGDSMQKIQGGAHRVVSMVSDISSALDEQSSAAADIARNVEVIAQMAEENSAAVAANAATAERLEHLAATLEAEVRPFRIS